MPWLKQWAGLTSARATPHYPTRVIAIDSVVAWEVHLSRYRIVRHAALIAALLVLLGTAPTNHTLDFVVPDWMSITTGKEGDTVIVVTAPASSAPIGSCAPPGVYSMQDALVVDVKGQRLRTYLITVVAYAGMPVAEGMPPGTRVRNLMHVRTCEWGEKKFNYYRGAADRRRRGSRGDTTNSTAAKQLPFPRCARASRCPPGNTPMSWS
jgi:hypothetical protein